MENWKFSIGDIVYYVTKSAVNDRVIIRVEMGIIDTLSIVLESNVQEFGYDIKECTPVIFASDVFDNPEDACARALMLNRIKS